MKSLLPELFSLAASLAAVLVTRWFLDMSTPARDLRWLAEHLPHAHTTGVPDFIGARRWLDPGPVLGERRRVLMRDAVRAGLYRDDTTIEGDKE